MSHPRADNAHLKYLNPQEVEGADPIATKLPINQRPDKTRGLRSSRGPPNPSDGYKLGAFVKSSFISVN